MTFQKRTRDILLKLSESGEVNIHELSKEFEIAEITIRRDLNKLAEKGLLYRTHGGAVKIDPLMNAKSFVNKVATNLNAKDAICKRASDEIEDGDIIFMDCGSTVFRLCQFIKNKKIRVITNSLPVVLELSNTQVLLNLIGGEVDANRQAVHGCIAEEHIARYRASKAFLGVDGISQNGLFAQSEKEASITSAMASQSNHTFILCDASKVGKENYLKFADLDSINTLITNADDLSLKCFHTANTHIIQIID